MDAKDIRNLQEAYLEVYSSPEELDEATAMAKRGLDEPAIRTQIARNSGGGQAADRATALADRPTYGQRGVNPQARQRLAATQRGDFRNTTSSSPGLHGYGHKSDDSKVKAIQAARGAQRGVLTPNEKKKLNREQTDLYDIILSHLLDEGYAETQGAAEVIMVNMSEDWRESIVEAIEGLRPASERMARGVLTSSQRASQKARARREEKKKEELEKAANAILNQIGGASRRSSAPMGSTQAPQKAEAPEANRRIKPRMKSDDLASAADKVLRGLR